MPALGAPGPGAVSGEEEHPAKVVLHHGRHHRLGAIECPVQHHPPNILPILLGQVQEGLVGTNGGVVQENVDAAKLVQGHLDHAVNLFLVGNIGQHGQGAAAQGPYFLGNGFRLLPVAAGVDYYVSPLLGKL